MMALLLLLSEKSVLCNMSLSFLERKRERLEVCK